MRNVREPVGYEFFTKNKERGIINKYFAVPDSKGYLTCRFGDTSVVGTLVGFVSEKVRDEYNALVNRDTGKGLAAEQVELKQFMTRKLGNQLRGVISGEELKRNIGKCAVLLLPRMYMVTDKIVKCENIEAAAGSGAEVAAKVGRPVVCTFITVSGSRYVAAAQLDGSFKCEKEGENAGRSLVGFVQIGVKRAFDAYCDDKKQDEAIRVVSERLIRIKSLSDIARNTGNCAVLYKNKLFTVTNVIRDVL